MTSIRDEVIELFKNFDTETSDREQVSASLCDVLNKGLKKKLTKDQVLVSLSGCNRSIDEFLKNLIGRTAIEDRKHGMQIGLLVKNEFPHFFSEMAPHKRAGHC
jgi:hypothetical protein